MSFASLIRGLTMAEVEFVVIGGVAAAAHGSARVTNDLDICYDASPDNRGRLARLLADWRAYLRGVELGLPFTMDARTLRDTPLMTLSTTEGELDVMDRVAGVGDYAAVRHRSDAIEAFGVTVHVLSLPALIAAKRAAARPKDLSHLPELEALLALRERGGA
ncbi:MAG: hypothetical protein WKG32_19975 [Gemmatimonadaceae bacterium]